MCVGLDEKGVWIPVVTGLKVGKKRERWERRRGGGVKVGEGVKALFV